MSEVPIYDGRKDSSMEGGDIQRHVGNIARISTINEFYDEKE